MNTLLENAKKVIRPEYFHIWNDAVQEKIDQDIETYRKTDASFSLENVPAHTPIQVEQLSHAFLFGANTFLFGDLKTPENNARYEDSFGELFNAATIAFYWKALEPEQGKPRYTPDSPYMYRRPATDPVVDFCESKGINMNGHTIIYGLRKWGHPTWIPEDRKAMEGIFEKHIEELAQRYGSRIQRWDVVNESMNQANRGLMPDDYTYKAFKWAMQYFPKDVQFNSNDNNIYAPISNQRRYVEIVRNLIDRGIRIDNFGIQMHIYNPEDALAISQGADHMTPAMNHYALNCLAESDRPLHVSEVTVSAPDGSESGEIIQAQITRNLYRLWFSHPKVQNITWWNLVDGGGAPGEPAFTGIFTQDMKPKLSYHVLQDLIHNEWKTSLTVRSDENGKIQFRGFPGKYQLTWQDPSGKTTTSHVLLT